MQQRVLIAGRLYLKGEPGAYDPCPCGSGTKARFCCRTSRHWYKKPRELAVSPPTDYAHPDCFAPTLNDCSQKISGEHVIPEALLEMTGQRSIKVSGMAWLGEAERHIPIAGLAPKVSCTRHNSLAGPFDDAVTALFRALHDFLQDPWTARDSTVRLFAGPDLERGLYKMLFCAATAGWAVGPKGVLRIPQGHPQLVQMIYRNASLAQMPGMHLMIPAGRLIAVDGAVSLGFLFGGDDPSAVVGLAVSMRGFSLVIALSPNAAVCGTAFAEAQRRPASVSLCDGDYQKTILISWPTRYGSDDTPIIARARHVPTWPSAQQ